HVMMVDMRAHGESEGRFVGFGVKESADLLGWMRKIDPKNRYRWRVHGFSMGAVTAMIMAQKSPDRFDTVIVDAPWIDFEALVKQELWKRAWLPAWSYPYVRWIARKLLGQDFEAADNRQRVRALCALDIRYLFEERDALLPAFQREALFAGCPTADVTLFRDVGHVEAFRADPDGYWSVVSAKGSLR
ncbi:MAG: alpha/beta hydrolase, partial [Epsilonproteobacteria bacterium]|nr:alpha/beta hydrolase [Campylobacterota bacterium]